MGRTKTNEHGIFPRFLANLIRANPFIALDHWLPAPTADNPGADNPGNDANHGQELKPFAAFDGLEIFVASDLKSITEEWRDFQINAAVTPFQNIEWISKTYHNVADTRASEPKILFVYERNQLRMIVPLAIERRNGLRCLVWLSGKMNDYCAPLVDPDWMHSIGTKKAQHIWEQILNRVSSIDLIVLTQQPTFIGSVINPFSRTRSRQFSCNAYFLDLGQNWPEFYSRLRSAKSRKRLREKEKRLKKSGRLVFRQARSYGEKIELINSIITWKSRQLDARGARNPFPNGDLKLILSEIAGEDTSTNFLRIYVLEVDAVPIAADIVLVQGDTMNLFLTGFDETVFRNCSAGNILLVKLLELASRSGLKLFDFSAGDEPYKMVWSAQRLDMTYSVRGRSLAGWFAAGLTIARIDLKRHIKSNDFLMGLLQNLNFHLTTIRGGNASSQPDNLRENPTEALPPTIGNSQNVS